MYLGDRDYFIKQILHTNELSLLLAMATLDQSYHAFGIPKNGGTRTIQAIRRSSMLYTLQKELCRNFLERIPLPAPAVGFVKGESYLTFLKPHVGRKFYLRLDIHGFFDTITAEMVKGQFGEFFSEKEPKNLADFLTLCTWNGCLPQGAVTSPAVSNVVFRRTDQRILKYCQSFDYLYRDGKRLPEDICYTRYADDMLFSSSHLDFSRAPYFTGMVSKILKDAGFRLNRSKTKYGRGEISLSGYVVSDNLHLSRKKLGSLSRLLFFLGKSEEYGVKKYRVRRAFFQEPDWLGQVNRLGLEDGRGGPKWFGSRQEFLDYLCGYRSFLLSVVNINGVQDGGVRQLENKVRKLESIIECILKQDSFL